MQSEEEYEFCFEKCVNRAVSSTVVVRPFGRFETSDDIVYLSVDSITLTDGTTIMLDNGFTTAGTNNFQADCFLNFDDLQSVDVEKIDYITMGGEDIQVAR